MVSCVAAPLTGRSQASQESCGQLFPAAHGDQVLADSSGTTSPLVGEPALASLDTANPTKVDDRTMKYVVVDRDDPIDVLLSECIARLELPRRGFGDAVLTREAPGVYNLGRRRLVLHLNTKDGKLD